MVEGGKGRIDVVATPIGNLADLSPRARDALARADAIAAEDTRHTAALLSAVGLSRPLVSLHDHNERDRIDSLLQRLALGQSLVLVSDAGTPLVSDPGFLLLRAAIDAGHTVSTVPGPSAVLAALTLSGLPAGRFAFEGFLPPKGAARRERLTELARETRTLVLFEAPHRIATLLHELRDTFGGERRAAIAREISKAFETVYRGTMDQLVEMSGNDANMARGEISVVIEGATPTEGGDAALADRLLHALGGELPPGRTAAIVARLTGVSRSDLYERARAPRDE